MITTDDLSYLVKREMALLPGTSEREALANLFTEGIYTEETVKAHRAIEAEKYARRYNVLRSPDQLRGWHLSGISLSKPGVYRYSASRRTSKGYEMINGFCRQDIIRVAIEQRICTGPDGYCTT